MYNKEQNRFGFLYFLITAFLIINFFTRVGLMVVDIQNVDLNIITLLKMFLVGFMYDCITIFYYFSPLVIYLLVIPNKIYNTKFHNIILYVIAISIFFSMIFTSISEYFFWEEFGKRFNFIAVDYLVYTQEVIRNIQESYPLPQILSGIAIASLFIIFIFRKRFIITSDNTTFAYRLKFVAIFISIMILFFNIFDKQVYSKISNNIYNNELAKNGPYAFFSAFRHNELAYKEFYKTLDDKVVFTNLKKLENFDDNTPKVFTSKNKKTKKNIILIMVESLSAKFMGVYGNTDHITPYLDKLTQQSLFFDNLYATGTRTVRGMEAVTLSVPPTPGRSIIKRPKNGTMDSVGKILAKEGYDNKFIYAGHGYFDNMNNFFSNNKFNIVDRLDFEDNQITFSNVWGVCDGDLLNKVISEADKSYQNKKPFFSFVMTTSNHRPYTYPNGKIDIPSHTGRNGAVKYTDYAIGNFIEKSKTKPWFKDTVFVIIADHNGGSAGKMSLPVYRYKIPLIVYAPYFIKPQKVSKVSSQMDTMPTILSLLGFNYKAKFYGNDILSDNFVQRAFIGNYQKLGYLKDNKLYFLTPDKKVHKMNIDSLKLNSVKYTKEKPTLQEIKNIITYYQSASIIYKNSK